jgi:hypothetical protein
MNPRIAFLCVLLVSGPALIATADDEEPHPYYTVVPGRFAVIGQLPDDGAPYKGRAKIAYSEGRFQLLKEIGETSVTAQGTVERADPGEGDVIRFRWPDHEETCLVRLDLDNYARLSCYWSVSGTAHRQPGLESYFPTDAWPPESQP